VLFQQIIVSTKFPPVFEVRKPLSTALEIVAAIDEILLIELVENEPFCFSSIHLFKAFSRSGEFFSHGPGDAVRFAEDGTNLEVLELRLFQVGQVFTASP
jgi:hypothetical protein